MSVLLGAAQRCGVNEGLTAQQCREPGAVYMLTPLAGCVDLGKSLTLSAPPAEWEYTIHLQEPHKNKCNHGEKMSSLRPGTE